MQIKVIDLELTQPLTAIEVEGSDEIHILVRQQHQPVGWVYLTPEESVVSGEQLQQAIAEQVSWDLTRISLEQEFFGPLENNASVRQPISVIVCTHNPGPELDHCVRSLLNQDYPNFEIILVDHSSEKTNLAQQVADLPVKYVRAGQSGISRARNWGIAAAQHELIAFVGAGVKVDRHWLTAVDRAFADPEVMAVTGLVVPDQFVTLPQALSDTHAHRWRDLRPFKIRHTSLSVKRLASPSPMPERDRLYMSQFTSGANMAFRRSILQTIGSFDATLGAGTPSRGGDCQELFYRLISAGHTVAHEPAMLGWQTPDSTLPAVWHQVYDQGCGLGASVLACLQRGQMPVFEAILFAIAWVVKQILIPLIRPRKQARSLLLIELAGIVMSPLVYTLSQWRVGRNDHAGLEMKQPSLENVAPEKEPETQKAIL